MGVYNFLKSKLGKATMVGTTAGAGVGANVVIADSLTEGMEVDAIKDGLINTLQANETAVNALSNSETYAVWQELQEMVAASSTLPQRFYDAQTQIADALSQVAVQSHYQPQTIIGTCAAVAVTALVWAGLYLIARKKAKKVASVQVEDIK